MNAVVERQATEVVQTPHPGTATTPSTLLAMAVAQGADLDRLERLMALQERWEAGEARKAFTQAMTDFKAEPLEIFKRKEVGYKTKEGDFVGYKHAQLCDVVDVVVPAMARHGLSHRWDVKQEGGKVLVTCTVTHRAGHSAHLQCRGAHAQCRHLYRRSSDDRLVLGPERPRARRHRLPAAPQATAEIRHPNQTQIA